MAKATQSKPKRRAAPRKASGADTGPVALSEPSKSSARGKDSSVAELPWLRGLLAILFAILTYIAQWVLLAAAVIQFFWLIFARERNDHIATFGRDLGRWLDHVARFQTAVTEDKPFPWSPWGK